MLIRFILFVLMCHKKNYITGQVTKDVPEVTGQVMIYSMTRVHEA